MANTTDFELCQQYIIKYITDIEDELHECQKKLTEQTQLCPVTTLPLEQIDSYMKKVVEKERQYLSLRNNDQLTKFKDNLHHQQLFQTISQYHLTFNHVSFFIKIVIFCIISFFWFRWNISIN